MHVGKFRGVLDQKLGSLSNDDDDGNENGRKAIGINWQNNNFARASRFFGQTVKTLIDLFSRFPPSLHCFIIPGKKAMSRGISGGKQVIKFANTGSLFIPSKQNDNFILAKCTVRVSTSFMSLLLAVSTRTVNTAYKKVIMITSTHA